MATIRGVKDRRFHFVQLLNSMFEDPKLSLKSKGFIGYCLTKKEDWRFHVSHLSCVLKEKERAIYSTINECIEHGYAIRYQPHKENGEFGEWETIVSDSKEEIILQKKELIEKGLIKESYTDCYFADAQDAVAQSAPHSNTVATEQDEKQQQQAVVVVSSNQESLAALKEAGFDDKTAQSLASFALERIHRQIEHLKKAQELIGVDNPLGWLRNAIEYDWKPGIHKQDFAKEEAELREKQLKDRHAIKKECQKLHDEYESRFTTKKYFVIGLDVLSCRCEKGTFAVPYDNGAVGFLKRFIEIEGL
jgi:hypothetical protein